MEQLRRETTNLKTQLVKLQDALDVEREKFNEVVDVYVKENAEAQNEFGRLKEEKIKLTTAKTSLRSRVRNLEDENDRYGNEYCQVSILYR